MTATIADVLESRAQWCVIEADCQQVPWPVVDHVITDPPYNQATSEGARRSAPDTNGGFDTGRYVTFDGIDGREQEIASLATEAARRWVVIFCALEQLGLYRVGNVNCWVRGTTWNRTNSAPQFTGDRPGQRHEGIAILHRKGRKRWNRGGECWSPTGVTANAVANVDRVDHPTPKPVWLMAECLDAFTDPGELVLDPFCGSGTTGVACLRLGRRFIGIEREPKYAAVARERLEAESRGLTLKAARAGQTSIFDALGESP